MKLREEIFFFNLPPKLKICSLKNQSTFGPKLDKIRCARNAIMVKIFIMVTKVIMVGMVIMVEMVTMVKIIIMVAMVIMFTKVIIIIRIVIIVDMS